MMQCRPLISKYLMLDIVKGNKALFWEDSWDDLPSLDSHNLPSNIKNTLSTTWGNSIEKYLTININDQNITSKWKSVIDTILTELEKSQYEQFINQRATNYKDRLDKLLWRASKDGKYIVNNGYEIMTKSQRWDEI